MTPDTEMISTVDAMLSFDFPEELLHWPHPPLQRVFQSLPDTCLRIFPSCNIKQTLVGFSILNQRCDLPVYF